MKQPKNTQLNSYLSALLKPKTSEQLKQSNYFFAYIKRLLKQNHLADIDADEVLNESVFRLIQYQNKHQTEVENYEALLKRISLNVIREMSRKQRLKQRVDYEAIADQLPCDKSSTERIYQMMDRQHLLKSFWQELSLTDRKILNLRIFEGQSWRMIAQVLSEQGIAYTVSSLRKRYERLVERLHQKMS